MGLTDEQYMEIGRAMAVAERKCPDTQPLWAAVGRAAYEAVCPLVLAEALAEPTDAELDAVERHWVFHELPDGILYRPSEVAQKVRDAACIFRTIRLARLTEDEGQNPRMEAVKAILKGTMSTQDCDRAYCEEQAAKILAALDKLAADKGAA